MITINVKLYDIVKTEFKLSDAKAREFTIAIQETLENNINHKQTEFKSFFREDLIKMGLNSKIEQTKTDMVKWFFAFFITLVAMILGLYAGLFLKY